MSTRTQKSEKQTSTESPLENGTIVIERLERMNELLNNILEYIKRLNNNYDSSQLDYDEYIKEYTRQLELMWNQFEAILYVLKSLHENRTSYLFIKQAEVFLESLSRKLAEIETAHQNAVNPGGEQSES